MVKRAGGYQCKHSCRYAVYIMTNMFAEPLNKKSETFY